MLAETVEIFEVGPRDGLQNEPRPILLADKIALIDALSTVGFRRIEAGSFVSPKRVPQMADSAEVLAGISRVPWVSYAALTPNLTGLERALAAGADEVAIFGSASEGFSQANINCSVTESLQLFAPVVTAALAAGLRVRGYVSCVVECPYDGPVKPAAVALMAAALAALGCYEISLGDTLGRATPEVVAEMLDAVLDVVPAFQLAGHFHDTAGHALTNIEVSADHGLRVFDASIGGLGGCPFAPGSAGNVATRAVHDRLTEMGFVTGLDAEALDRAAGMALAMRG